MRLILSLLRTIITLLIMVAVVRFVFVYTSGPQPLGQPGSGKKAPESVQSGDAGKSGMKAEGTTDGGEEKDGGPGGDSLPQQTPAPEKGKNTADPVGTVKNTAPQNPGGYFMTLDEVFAIANISLADKLAGLSILGKLNKGDMDVVFNMAEDGITYGELDKIKSMLSKTLSGKEVDKLNDILMKNKQMYAEGKLK